MECFTDSAYCMAPSFFSWLGKGTSRRGLPVTLSGGPRASCDGVTSVVADLVDVDEMKADVPLRNGISAEEGLAIRSVKGGNRSGRMGFHLVRLRKPQTL